MKYTKPTSSLPGIAGIRTNRLMAGLAAAIVLCAGTALADVTPSEPETDAMIARRTAAISKSLRCVVCQNQSIHDSSAPLAQDMRRLVEKRVRAGDNDKAVRDALRTHYGDYILMNPPLQANTIVLWATPFILLLSMLAGFVFWCRSKTRQS